MTVIYSYPSDIHDEIHQYRKLTISVKEPKQSDSNIYNTAIEKAEKMKDVIVAGAEIIMDVSLNLEMNRRSLEDETIATIVLPLPNSFSDSQSHSWSTETGILGTAGEKLRETSITGGLEKVVNKAAPAGIAGVLNTFTDYFQSVTIDKVLGESSAKSGLQKPLIDPGYFQNYSGSQPRSFSMSFDLVPNSPEEATAISMILMKLKQYSSPFRSNGGVSLLAPYYFSLEISNRYITNLAKIDRVVLTNIAIDYMADGSAQFHTDGVPKHMTVALDWQEVDMTTANDYSTRPA